MCVAVPAIIAKVAKKILAILLGDEKGRKTLGYIVGIALFIVLLPVLAVYGLFGWMAGAGATEVVNYDVVYGFSEHIKLIEYYRTEGNESRGGVDALEWYTRYYHRKRKCRIASPL